MFRDGAGVDCRSALARWPILPTLRIGQRSRGSVIRRPTVAGEGVRQRRHGHGSIQPPVSRLGRRRLSLYDEHQRRFVQRLHRELDPILDTCVAIYLRNLDEDGQVDFKGKAKGFVRTYAFLSCVLPYMNADWEKRSIFLNFLIAKLPAPKEEDLSKGILDAIDMGQLHRIEKRAMQKIMLPDEDAEIDPVPPGGGGHKADPELDRLSNIIREFNDHFGGIQWEDADRVAQLITETNSGAGGCGHRLQERPAELRQGNNLKKHVDKDGRIYRTIKSAGKIYKYYDDDPVLPTDVWLGINHLQQKDPERYGYPTQKPLRLYERIILASSNEGDMVLDPFCGCATTAVAAERLGRQWTGIDIWESAHQAVIERLRKERLLAPDGDRRGGDLFPVGHEQAAPFLRVKERIKEPEGRKMSRAEMYEFLLTQHGSKCQGCDRVFDDQRYLELDHNTPRSDGGLNHISNRILLCGPCNRLKSNTYTRIGLRRENKKRGYMR